MFIPQRPYFPDGSLRDALAYPQPAAHYNDAELRQALTDALLPQLAAGWTTRTPGARSSRAANSSGWRSPACC